MSEPPCVTERVHCAMLRLRSDYCSRLLSRGGGAKARSSAEACQGTSKSQKQVTRQRCVDSVSRKSYTARKTAQGPGYENRMIIYCESPRALSRAREFIYQLLTCLLENDHRLHKLPEPIPNSEVKLLLARLVLPWGTRWESRVLFSSFAFVDFQGVAIETRSTNQFFFPSIYYSTVQ